MSFLYRNPDSTRFYLQKSYGLSNQDINGLDNKLGVLSLLINSDGFHFDLKNLKKDINTMDSIMVNDPLINSLVSKNDYLKFLNTNKGNYHFKLNNLSKAKKYFEELLDTFYTNVDSLTPFDIETKINIQQYLASIYRREGKNDLAEEYYNRIISDIENHKIPRWQKQSVGVKYRLSQVLMAQKKYDEAKKIQLESLDFFETMENKPGTINSIKAISQLLIKNYLAQDSVLVAIKYIEKSKNLYKKEDILFAKLEVLTGDAFLQNMEFEKAETFYQSYLSKTKVYSQNQKNQDVADAFSRLGSLYLAKENPEKALEFYQNSLIQIAPSFNDTDIKSNPNPKKVLSKLELVKLLKEKLEALQLLYKKENQLEDLKIALATSYAIIEALDLLKPEFESKVDKQFLISEMYPAFHKMVEVAYDLYNSTKESSYIADAFYFTEKSKSVLLLEAARSAQANSYGGVPEEIIDKEQQHRANIIHLEKKFFNQKSNMVVFDSLFQLKNRYYNFISDLERDYPKYYDLKYDNEVVSLEEATSKIIKNKALISYFATNTDFYVITLENQNKNFYKIHLGNDGREKITSFYSLLSKLNIKELPDIYGIGNSIYEQILKKPLETIESKELIIIPDDILNYLPFEALSTSKSAGDYLIREYQISYTNSVTLLREQQNKLKLEQNKLLAYAPSFENSNENVSQNRPNFGPLLYNTDEVTQITEFFDGKAITGKEASLASFSKNSHAYNMLHFASHAATNDEYPDYSYLAFAKDDSSENGLLYVKDLYGYSINADLVALSGCQTGLGKLQKGEGMLSLARGFSYAGAKSLVTTLWKVNDRTTSELIQEFYKNLDASFPKDKALREAKLTYLKTAEDKLLTHPYYWSGFMISGDTTALQTDASYLWWLLLLGIPILFVTIRKVRSLL
ncbi:CHAT domain-containing protein [uncultured Aquimarina sp.]|uniref:CHAT domain-containing protein n=1 Tax=uncultured Aquimarina sp. TaxID=575652 RepID=UPI0026171DD6|nr:CHAT domain-containing protein [uncultured Aquimarina sp.]